MQTKKRRIDGTIHEKIVLTGYYHREELISKLEPVKNWTVYSNVTYAVDGNGNPKETPLVACTTNSYGALRPMTKTFRGVAPIGLVEVHHMVMPPAEMMAHAATAYEYDTNGFDWKVKIGEAIRQNSALERVAFRTQKISFDLLRKPKDIPNDGVDDDEGYRVWYKTIKKDSHGIKGIVIPKTRAVFFVVYERYANSQLTIYINGKKYTEGVNDKFQVFRFKGAEGFYGYVLYGTDKTLPVGQYRVEVDVGRRPNSDTNRWYRGTAESGCYTIIDYVRFPLRSHFTEMDVILCDPISVEEALVNQFPDQYMHLAKIGANTTADDKKGGAKKASLNGFDRLATMLKRKKEIAELVHGVAFSDSGTGLTFALGKALQDRMNVADVKTVDSMNLAFSTIKTWESMQAFKENGTRLLTYANGAKDGDAVTAAIKKSYVGRGFLKKAEKINKFDASLASKMSQKILRFDLPEASQKILTPINRLMKPVEIASNISVAKKGIDDYSAASDSLDVSVKNYQHIVRDYFDRTFFIDQDEEKGGETFFTEESMQQVFYDSDRFEVTAEHKGQVDAAAAYLLDHRNDTSRLVFVKGYTDSTASAAHNLELSINRASGVKQAIVSELKNRKEAGEKIHLNALSDRILTLGYGEKYAGQDIGDEAKKAENRRSDIHFGEGAWSQGGFRDGMDYLEKQRKLTVATMLEMDDTQKKALLAVFDAVLSVGSVIPLTAAPALYLVAAIELGKAGLQLYDNAFTVVDNWMFDGLMNRIKTLEKDLQSFTKNSHGNTLLIIDEKVADNQKLSADEFVESIDLMDSNFRIRSEAVAGLFNLLYRAQLSACEKYWRDTGENPKESPIERVQHELQKNRVAEYITNFILNDGWSFPLERHERSSLAEFWQLAVNTKGVEQDEDGVLSVSYRGNFFLDKDFFFLGEGRTTGRMNFPPGADSTSEKQAEPLSFHGSSRGGDPFIPSSYQIAYMMHRGDHVVSDFQKNFPIHTMDSKDVNRLSEMFAPTRAGEYGEDIYEYMNIYTRRREQKKDEDWVPMARRRRESDYANLYLPDGTPMDDGDHFDALSPFDQVRVIVVLKKEATQACTASIQLHRGNENKPGIKFKTIMRPLVGAELITDEERAFKGRIGVVFEPFYQLAFQTVRGLKPMAGFPMNLMPMGIYEAMGLLEDVPYYLSVMVAHAPKTKKVICYPKSHDHFKKMMERYSRDYGWFLLTVDPDKEHVVDPACLSVLEKKMYKDAEYKMNGDGHYLVKDEDLFLEKDFLNSLTSADAYPTLMEDDIHATALIKVGDGEWVNGHRMFRQDDKSGKTLTLDGFTWDKPVEFMVVASCKKVKESSREDYEKRGFKWTSIPATLTLFQDGFF
ncbi:OmpA family protein [Desulfoluna spongiiphila]|uniref:OmpA family protein n=1 Tax=Desulfoluna spongiiphila TaxID=419481 RepID=A0A1G5HQ15_9BACT|nr:OmpA family protein [Desulfoluna spongiiphila]SCY65876.1 OmpA family protein [Desulfoluna spongiiphila]